MKGRVSDLADFQTIRHENINEEMHVYTHKSGLKAFVIPKKGYSKKYATFATHYGSINNYFCPPDSNEKIRVPDGIAHFLEHKLFEQKDGSVMDKFSALGSNPNAYTSFSQTVYLFSCTDRFEDNFALLLDFVQNPFITEESVEKEKGIIGQEIKMYDDNPGWRAFFNLLKAFYEKNPVCIDIAGTVDSIAKINRDVLYKCYNTFYNLSNMVILVVGDVDSNTVFDMVEKSLRQTEDKGEIERIFPEREAKLNKGYIEQRLDISMPMFMMGFRDDAVITKGVQCLRREVAIKILLEMILGRSSALYNKLYSEGLINNTFEIDYTAEESYAFSNIGGESKNPEKVRELLVEEIGRIKDEGLDGNTFNRIKKSMQGRFLRGFNSVENVSHLFMSVYFKEVNVFDYVKVYDTISFEDVEKIFGSHFDLDKLALSVVLPYQGEK